MSSISILTLVISSLLVRSIGGFQAPNGPMQIPAIGSWTFLARLFLKKDPLPQIVKEYKHRYGAMFEVKTGPIVQYWVTDAEGDLAAELLNTLDCAGRSQLKEPAFGNDFLFLTREVDRARDIRRKQREWVRSRGSPPRISLAVQTAYGALDDEFHAPPEVNPDASVGVWNQDAVSRHSVRALLGTLIGGPSRSQRNFRGTILAECREGWLTDPELDALTEATANYRRRGPRGRLVGSKESYASVVSGILRKAIARSVEIDPGMASSQLRIDALPILVSAIVGGSEIYPLLLHWAIRHLAVSPGLQQALRADCKVFADQSQSNASTADAALSYGSLIQKFVGYAAWAHPYSVAIGPPRKLTSDVILPVNVAPEGCPPVEQEVRLRKEAIMFIVHPGLELDWNARFLHSAAEPVCADVDEGKVLTIADACLLRGSAEEAAKEVKQCKSTSWSMFGMGERACIAPEMSTSFLGSMLCAVLSRYEVRVSTDCEKRTVRDLFAYEEDGSLLVPKHNDIRIELHPVQ